MKYKIIVKDSLNADGVYFVQAKNAHEACIICQRENRIRNSQSGTTYSPTIITGKKPKHEFNVDSLEIQYDIEGEK